ncbi:hypothetical protein JTB14_006827, partial [Gonioctena quinquepunctata]
KTEEPLDVAKATADILADFRSPPADNEDKTEEPLDVANATADILADFRSLPADHQAQFRAFEPESQENSSAPSMPSALLVGKEDHEILLATAVVDVLSENGCLVKARLILDNGSPKLPTLQLTRLGWVIGGHLPPQIIPKQNKVSLLRQNACEAGDSLDKILAKFWEVEELPEFKSLSADEEHAEQSFIQTHVRLENGTFQVDFPFKRPGEKIPLGDSFHIAKGDLRI